jgi:hypothetical protein
MSNVADSFPELIEVMAQRAISEDVMARLKDLEIEIPGSEPESPFKSPQEIFDYVRARPEIMEKLREKVLRMQLGLAVAYLCGFIAAHRELGTGRGVIPLEP